MKTIAIDAIDINSFGGLVHLKQISNILSKKNINLKIYSNSFVKKNIGMNKNIHIIKKNIFSKNFIIRHIWKIFFFKRELKKINCSLLLSLNGVYHGLFKPTILLQQNILPFDKYAKSQYGFFSQIKFFLQKYAILISIKIHKNMIFTSFDTKNRILKNLKQNTLFNSSIIYHGVKKPKNPKKIEKIKFFKKKIRLLYVSEFQKYKNHEKLFKAINHNTKNLNVSLTCIGRFKSSYIKKLNMKYDLKKLKINLIKNYSHQKILKIYNNYDAFIFPTICESFGLPLLEASANRIPVLCSDLRVFKEIYGKGCIYFNPHRPDSIKNKIKFFSSLKRNELKKKIKINYLISKKLTWINSGNSYYKTIVKTLSYHEKKN